MADERIAFLESVTPDQYVRLMAAGEIDSMLLDALEAYVMRQRKRLGHATEKDAP